MDCALDDSDAKALGDLGAFVNVREHNSVPCFYSCEINTPSFRTARELLYFNVSIVRRRNLAIESECHNLDECTIFLVEAVNILKAIRILVACPTLTDARFSHYRWGAFSLEINVLPEFEDLMSEVFSLLKSSPSLSCFQFCNSLADASLYCKHLRTLVCENPRLETLWVSASGPNFVVLAKAIAVCLSRNTVLKSFMLPIPTLFSELNREALEILLRPLTSSSPSEANAHLKELALYLQHPGGYGVDVIANLLCRNTTLKKLDLRFSKSRSGFEDGKSSWREFCRALEVNQTLEELSCPCEVAALGDLLVPFVPDRYGRQPNTTLSTLRVFVSNKVHGRRVEVLVYNVVDVLRDLASALQRNTTLKHVQCINECITDEDFKWLYIKWYDTKCIINKNLWQGEFQIQEILRTMIDNELRINTSLESFAVGHWTLLRVGTEWQTSYRGPCLREQTRVCLAEYNVKVKMAP
ncbi:hypothetical protein KC19_6G205400 [Ceratodon purpureus]|uniref:Uncharacterized protein n=1 Tax=Ceratodon purpureus TaxID=3225 RepID=A0A8T0HJP6_CERPU|nr:hypothetical protein KC19_6G205400 [Ceratodon purpureus]